MRLHCRRGTSPIHGYMPEYHAGTMEMQKKPDAFTNEGEPDYEVQPREVVVVTTLV